jgi:hypothetical protein
MKTPSGIEKLVAEDIAERQAVGYIKYGVTVQDAGLDTLAWLEHAYQESLDLPIYLKAAIEQEKKKRAAIIEALRRI